jgi:hypothetical protein
MKKLFLIFAGIVMPAAFAAAETHPALADELLQMQARDVEARNAAMRGDYGNLRAVDTYNLKRLKQIVDEHGWPGFSMVGEDAASAAFLLAQHADSDRPFQLRVLALMDASVKRGQALAKHYAYLHDRTHYPQRFGTQGNCVSRQEWQPFLIEEAEGVHQRRQEVDLLPLSEYVAMMNKMCADSPHSRLQTSASPRQTMPVPK